MRVGRLVRSGWRRGCQQAGQGREMGSGGTILEGIEGHSSAGSKGLSIFALETGFQISEENGWEGPAERQGAVCG